MNTHLFSDGVQLCSGYDSHLVASLMRFVKTFYYVTLSTEAL